jgi:hypothetical protein
MGLSSMHVLTRGVAGGVVARGFGGVGDDLPRGPQTTIWPVVCYDVCTVVDGCRVLFIFFLLFPLNFQSQMGFINSFFMLVIHCFT